MSIHGYIQICFTIRSTWFPQICRYRTVWLDEGLMLLKVTPKVATGNFNIKVVILIALKVTKCKDYFCQNFFQWELTKIAQSDHTEYKLKNIERIFYKKSSFSSTGGDPDRTGHHRLWQHHRQSSTHHLAGRPIATTDSDPYTSHHHACQHLAQAANHSHCPHPGVRALTIPTTTTTTTTCPCTAASGSCTAATASNVDVHLQLLQCPLQRSEGFDRTSFKSRDHSQPIKLLDF